MKHVLNFVILLFTALSTQVVAQDTSIFPKGNKAANVHHTGDVWLSELNEADSTFSYSTAFAYFNPGARLDWHTHLGGQILLITEGIGYYQEKGKPRQTVHKGETIKCLPGVEHWHGSTLESVFSYIGITNNHSKGRTIWLQKVTDEEYGGRK